MMLATCSVCGRRNECQPVYSPLGRASDVFVKCPACHSAFDPRLVSIPGMSTEQGCLHETISFGSGGHYIFCKQCRAIWCARPEGDGAMNQDTYKAAQSNICQTGDLGPDRKA